MDTLASLPATALRHWCFSLDRDTRSAVLPDGCRDLIVVHTAGGPPRWFISPLADGMLQVPGRAGQHFAGLRFHPAARIDEAALLDAARRLDADDPLELGARIEEHVRVDHRLAEALQALASSAGVAPASRALGVSERSLERLLLQATARAPRYWKNLARARRAAAALAGTTSLAEVAAEHGYADQAHMSRDFRRWFGCPPARFRADRALLALAAEPGYA